jgi:hypothetical protein
MSQGNSLYYSYLKQKMPCFKNRGQEGKTGPVWGLALAGVGRILGKGVTGCIWCKYYIYMYVNGKMRPVKTIPGMGEGDKGE